MIPIKERVLLPKATPQMLFTGINKVVTVLTLEDPIGTDRPLWRDYSRYDEDVNLEVAKANGVLGFAGRCVLGWSGVDDTFQDRYIQGGDLGLYRTSYGVLYPSLSVVRFCDHWFARHPVIDVIPRVLDAELQDNQSNEVVGEKIWEACEIIKAYDGVYPIVYSRYLLLDQWLRRWTQDMINSIYYWGARYLWDRVREHPGPPYGTMPNVSIPEENWVLHQTADKKPPFSGETGRSTIVDWDRWEIGNVTEMHQWISTTWGGVTPPTESSWYYDIDTWARANGFESEYAPPSG